MEQQHLLKPTEVAQKLNVSTQTLYRWRKNGLGPAWLVLRTGNRGTIRYLPLTVANGSDDDV